ncbi:MAG: transporter permease [Frankiales bacterium]|nr:transporter permease [Frankiales bacterium]
MATVTEAAPVSSTGRPPRRKSRRNGWSGKRIAAYAVLVFFAIFYLYPFFIQTVASLKDDPQAASSPLSLPNPVDLTAWKQILGLGGDATVPILKWLSNSVFVTVVVTISRVFFDSLAGYALSRLKFRGRGFLFATVLAVMSVPGVALLIPKFLIVTQLGIFDTYSAMILPLLVDAAGVFIMKQFFDTVSVSIEEAARIDGAGVFRTYWSVVLPMARPALITLTILSFQGSWNEFSHFLVTTQSPDHKTLVTGLASLTSGELGAGSQFPLKMGAALLTTIPVALLFFAFQRHFVRGATEGGVKG